MDPQRENFLLLSIARTDSTLRDLEVEQQQLPKRVAELERTLAKIDAGEAEAAARLESMQKERRVLEQSLQDHEEQLKKYKGQLMQVGSNKEYTAMLHEIGAVEKKIDEEEERLLVLMDEVETATTSNKETVAGFREQHGARSAEKQGIEARLEEITAHVARLHEEKPKLLTELETATRKRYERLLQRHGDAGVVRLTNGYCGGCGTQTPPQVAVEVRKGDQIITCQSCGRMLVDDPA
ncbi:MAG: C4-type zinc ribbon domain-containing protein [Candidatus Krumholzibacteria bacterium]|nr:C4-type zinc ribbon domain-containing protein [Candidatus Krumholzibacteria bacterium]